MAFSKEQNKYLATRWPSPVTGDLLDEGLREVNYNKIIFDVLRPVASKSANLTFFQKNNYLSPNSLETDTYETRLLVIKGTLDVWLNDKKLVENTDYTFASSFKRIRLINIVNGSNPIGLLYATYVPEEPVYLYGTLDSLFYLKYGVKTTKLSTSFVYEILTQLRIGIQNVWVFLKKTEPVWTGGIQNQQIGRDNLTKYKTPITNNHWNEIIIELDFLNNFLVKNFSYSITVEVTESLAKNEPLIDNTVLNLMKGLNDIESNLQSIYESGSFDDKINPNGIFK